MFLEAHFGDVELHMPDVGEDKEVEKEKGEDEEEAESANEPSLLVELDEAVAKINLKTLVSFPTFACRVIRRRSKFLVSLRPSRATMSLYGGV